MATLSSRSYTTSVIIHVAVLGFMFGLSWYANRQERKPTEVFEVVAGAGDNWSATVAPAAGTSEGAEPLKVPDIPKQTPLKLAPLPEETEAVEPAPTKPAPSVLDEKKTTFAQDVKRLSEKRYNRKIAAYKQEKKKEEERKKKEEAKRISKAEFDKKNTAKPSTKGAELKKIDAKGIVGGVAGGSTDNTKGGANGTALKTEARLMDQYFAFLRQRLKAAHIPPPGAGDELSTIIEFYCPADGVLSRIKVSGSSGDAEFDLSVVEAFKRVKGIGARPDGKAEVLTLEFKAKED